MDCEREERKKRDRRLALAAGIFLLLAMAAGGVYTCMARQYQRVFFPNTMINGRDASGRTAEEVKAWIEDGLDGYVLQISEREGAVEQISGQEIGLHLETVDSLEQILTEQKPMKWGLCLIEGSVHTIETTPVWDAQLLETAVNSLNCMDERQMKPPVDACISEYRPGEGYQIVPEQPGTTVVRDRVMSGIADALLNQREQVSLEKMGAYRQPAITSENPQLIAEAAYRNRFVNMTVTYRFGEETEVLAGDTIHEWIHDDGDGSLTVDENAVKAYVKYLAETYDTAYRPKTFKTSYGETVTIEKGNYGWKIDQKKETKALAELILSGESQEREPVYIQTAASRGEYDYGDTYVEINLTAQHLFYYKDGVLVTESDFVSGNEARGMGTPSGAYALTYKQRNAVLKGRGYASPVSYWMPFNRGIGMHDASWRGKFGGKIYRTNGSHGCINLPAAAARTIYETITAGTPVLCYRTPTGGL